MKSLVAAACLVTCVILSPATAAVFNQENIPQLRDSLPVKREAIRTVEEHQKAVCGTSTWTVEKRRTCEEDHQAVVGDYRRIISEVESMLRVAKMPNGVKRIEASSKISIPSFNNYDQTVGERYRSLWQNYNPKE